MATKFPSARGAQGDHRRRPCARPGDAVLRRRQLFLSADQVLSKISPNVSVWAVEPTRIARGVSRLTGEPHYDAALRRHRAAGHGVPFYGLRHASSSCRSSRDRCRLIAEACREVPKTSKELVPVCSTSTHSTCTRWDSRRRTDRPCQLHAGRRASDRSGSRRRAPLQDNVTRSALLIKPNPL